MARAVAEFEHSLDACGRLSELIGESESKIENNLPRLERLC
ncbi:hypothetical protein [Thiorhodovibrio winogradskyi]|nr:hypothetical protein [Thiorhodovibrio winogradskyi]